jgi:hypothetical protein
MVDSSYELPGTDEEDDEGSGSGGAGAPGGSSNGEPGGSGLGNEPQAQAITDRSGDEPQGRQDLVEVSFDDIDNGPGEPPGCSGSRVPHAVPHALRSRAGIMLDTAAMPPGLTPLVLTDAARIGSQPLQWHELA